MRENLIKKMNFPLVLFWFFFFPGWDDYQSTPQRDQRVFPPVTYTRKVIFICPLLPPEGQSQSEDVNDLQWIRFQLL